MALAAPIQTGKEKLKDRIERGILIAELKRKRELAMQGEAQRRACDAKGIKLARGYLWEQGITAGRTPINTPMATSIVEQYLSRITKNKPVFEIEPIASENHDAARLLEGVLLDEWEMLKMQEMIKSSSRLSAFTRPPYLYAYWDSAARGGIGGMGTRIIPGFRCIADNTKIFVKDMEYPGFREVMTRAKAIQLFPDKAKEIEAAAAYAADTGTKGNVPDDPLALVPNANPPGQLTRLVANNQNQFTGKTTVKIGGRKTPNPMTQKIEVEFLWLDDDTPVERERPKKDSRGKIIYRHTRDEDTGHLNFERKGFRVVQTPRGPRYLPNLHPVKEPVMETVIEKLYPHRRHIAWIPQDQVILWDVRWDGPAPLVSLRLKPPIYEYWEEGVGLRLASLAVARNILLTIIFQRLKLSLSGTWLATPQSGLRRNKLTSEDGQVFYAKKIDQDNIKQFPVSPLDVAYVQVLHEIEAEMMKLVGVAAVQQGKPGGRVDTGQAYDSLIEQSGTVAVESAQLLGETVADWARLAAWYYSLYGTHEHFVEVEEDDGETKWKAAMAIALKGDYAFHVDVVSNTIHSDSAKREMLKEGASLGLYPIPLLAKLGNYPQWRRGLRMREALMKDPSKAWMLGVAGAPPGQAGTLPKGQAAGKRSHHGPAERRTPTAFTAA